jgi:hypothetical protein
MRRNDDTLGTGGSGQPEDEDGRKEKPAHGHMKVQVRVMEAV